MIKKKFLNFFNLILVKIYRWVKVQKEKDGNPTAPTPSHSIRFGNKILKNNHFELYGLYQPIQNMIQFLCPFVMMWGAIDIFIILPEIKL